MNDFAAALSKAFALIGGVDAELLEIVVLSLSVSLSGSACAFLIGAPLGTAFAVYRFPGRNALIVIANALLGLPPVVVGLVVYLLLSRSGPLGSFGILFTPTAIVIKKALMFFALSLALYAPVGGLTLALIAGTTAVMTIHPQQVLAKLRHFKPLSAQPAKDTKEPA
jgi:tungstate transport system permease protein